MDIEHKINIKKVEAIFIEFEQTRNHTDRIKIYKKAIEKITEIKDNDPSEKTIKELNKINYLYTRKLIEELSPESIVPLPEEEWLEYYVIINVNNEEICKKVLQDNPDLNTIWNKFIESWNDDLEYIRKYLKRKNLLKKTQINNKKESTMTVLEAAIIILKEEGAPLSSKEIANRILKQNLVTSRAKRPEYSIAQTLEKNIRMRINSNPILIFLYDENNTRKIWLNERNKKIFSSGNKISINNIPDELMVMINYVIKEKVSESKDEVLVRILKRGLQEIIIERKKALEDQLNKLNEIS